MIICSKCGEEITVAEGFPGGFYARCNCCCSMEEGSNNYVFSHLSTSPKKALRLIIMKGLAKEIDNEGETINEISGKERVSKNPKMDTIFHQFYCIQGA